jgi:hypothetical protein
MSGRVTTFKQQGPNSTLSKRSVEAKELSPDAIEVTILWNEPE